MNQWLWSYEGFDPDEEGQREALLALGNGYVATRGALSESSADDIHYPGTYPAGIFNRLSDEISGRTITNESIVNAPNWLLMRCRVDDEEDYFNTARCKVLEHHMELDLRRAQLTRRSRLRDSQDRVLSITERRFVSLRNPHLMAMETTYVAENFEGTLNIESALDATVTNSGIDRYKSLSGDHFEPVASDVSGEVICVEVRTNDSSILIAEAARTRVRVDGEAVEVERRPTTDGRFVSQTLGVAAVEGAQVTVEKVVALFTSKDQGIYSPADAATLAVERAGDFDDLLESHIISWSHAWNRAEITLSGDIGHTQRILNLHIFHLLQTVSKNTTELDVGVPARGLHGEAYRGHIFWDELFIFPFLALRVPEINRALLRYRTRRLEEARAGAAAEGYAGAMFPWQSGSNGREETQILHLNPKSGRWLPDASHLQRHINAAVAFNIWHYWQVTTDLEFMRFWGAETMLEIARFWASAATYNHVLDRYEILGVMGPDEYHEGYPDREQPGLDNNAYTNVMAVWCLLRAMDVLELLPTSRRVELSEKLHISREELDRWDEITHKMRLCFHDDNVLSQFEGYGDLDELDWGAYREKYGNIQRLDRILEAEGDTPNRYKLAKQADTLMLFYLFSADEIRELFGRLGYEIDEDFFARNIHYYEARTSHGSTLSKVVHAWVHSRLDRTRSWELFCLALAADINDVQGGTTAEGIHLGAMAGTVDLVQRCYAGIETREDALGLNPRLPEGLHRLKFSIIYRRQILRIEITHKHLRVRLSAVSAGQASAVVLDVRGELVLLEPGDTFETHL